jgi:hypothetical protein
MKNIIIPFLLLLSFSLKAQDTLVVLQYNLLNYGNYTSYCSSNNNNVSKKDGYIKTIINYLKPDIFSVNEMVADEAMMEHLKNKINETWITKYQRPPFVQQNSDYIANTLYYNSNKISFHSQYIAQNYLRDVNVYKFYYNSSDLENGDTVFFYCVVAHLKAGSGTSNSDTRKIMASNTMNYIAGFDPVNNYLLMGDFNLYSASEPAWHVFTQNSNQQINFNDPINQSGDWHNNYNYRKYHTQSTHETSNGCAAGGGMDDRFDFILISNDVKNGTKKAKYVNGSYHAVGQDGKHFNKSINSTPVNTSVPSNVLTALYKNSDHLPVTLKLAINAPVGINETQESIFNYVSVVNPAGNMLKMRFSSKKNADVTLSLYDFTGRLRQSEKFNITKGETVRMMDVSGLNPGIYILRINDGKSLITRKLVKKRL